jgi:hypothetical protein
VVKVAHPLKTLLKTLLKIQQYKVLKECS